VPPTEQGQLQGAQGSLTGIASMMAPLLYTQLFAAAIGPLRGVHLPGLPFLVAAGMLVAALVVASRAETE
jgi:DHA1 family tetracycline resistance protein-like MFS transporter